MNPVKIPDGVLSLVKIPLAAQALRLPERHIRSMVEAGALECAQPAGRNGHRYIRTADLKRYADTLGIPVHWDDLIAV